MTRESDSGRSPDVTKLVKAWREAALDPYTDAPTSTEEWLKAIELGADAAVRVVLEHLIDRSKTHGDAGAVKAMYALEVELGGDEDA